MEAIIPAVITTVGGFLGAKALAPEPQAQQPLPTPEPVKKMPDPLLFQQAAKKKEMERQRGMRGRAGTNLSEGKSVLDPSQGGSLLGL